MRLAQAIRRATGSLARDLKEFVMPQRCPGCGGEADSKGLLCESCLARVPVLSSALCARCLRLGREPVGCARHPAFRVWAAWVYDERAALVIHALKYGARPELAPSLGEIMARALPPLTRPDLVLEVPLHAARRRERGYNQAALLADALAEAIAVPRLRGSLERVRATRPQAGLGPTARRDNLAGAFRARRPAELEGRELLIVDDVLTTGATIEACLETLADAGARATGVALAWAQ